MAVGGSTIWLMRPDRLAGTLLSGFTYQIGGLKPFCLGNSAVMFWA